jgi:hypothetical protein
MLLDKARSRDYAQADLFERPPLGLCGGLSGRSLRVACTQPQMPMNNVISHGQGLPSGGQETRKQEIPFESAESACSQVDIPRSFYGLREFQRRSPLSGRRYRPARQTQSILNCPGSAFALSPEALEHTGRQHPPLMRPHRLLVPVFFQQLAPLLRNGWFSQRDRPLLSASLSLSHADRRSPFFFTHHLNQRMTLRLMSLDFWRQPGRWDRQSRERTQGNISVSPYAGTNLHCCHGAIFHIQHVRVSPSLADPGDHRDQNWIIDLFSSKRSAGQRQPEQVQTGPRHVSLRPTILALSIWQRALVMHVGRTLEGCSRKRARRWLPIGSSATDSPSTSAYNNESVHQRRAGTIYLPVGHQPPHTHRRSPVAGWPSSGADSCDGSHESAGPGSVPSRCAFCAACESEHACPPAPPPGISADEKAAASYRPFVPSPYVGPLSCPEFLNVLCVGPGFSEARVLLSRNPL